MNGYFAPVSLDQQARNIIARLRMVKTPAETLEVVTNALIIEGAVTPEFVRTLDYMTRQFEAAQKSPEQIEDEAAMRTDELMSDYGEARHQVTHYQKGL